MSLDTDRLMKNARTHLPGVLDNVILLEYFNVLDEFFQSSGIWQETVTFSVFLSDPVGTVYYVEPESVSAIVRLIRVYTPGGHPVPCVMAVPGEITFMTPPGTEGTHMADLALTVDDPTNRDGYPECPQWILNKYFPGLLDGLLGKMMAQPAKPYTNEKFAQYHLKRFSAAIAVAATESVHKNVANAQAWRFPQSFATRRR